MLKLIQKTRAGGLVLGASAVLMATSALADIVHLDDVIVDGSLCVGQDCVNGENFGSDALRLKENNLRVHFDDTSAGAFPANDWRIVINDASSGGANYFAVHDATGNTTPFRVDAAAPTDALRVDDNGEVGLGTALPTVKLHMVKGNTPTIRLEQDGSAGFTLQSWDIAGNEAGFFVRDVTHASSLPFRILPGAASQALLIAGDGDIGIGAGTVPNASLHVKRTNGTAKVLVEETSGVRSGRQMVRLLNYGNPQIALVNTFNNQEWEIGAGLNLVIKNLTAGTTPFKVSPAGNLTLTGTLTTTGSCSVGCDRVFDADYALPSIEDHAAEMFAKSYLPNVGPTAENGQYELTSKVLGMLNELEQAHIFISQLNDKISALEAKIAKVE